MIYFYHGVPEDMVGTKLVPLNNMGGELAEIKKLYLKKYEGREEVLERKIPLLNCLWNDVVQLLPLDPTKVFQLQVDIGLIPEIPHYKFYRIDIAKLAPEKTAIFFKTAPGEENVEIKMLKDVDLEKIQEVPEATRKYYQSLVGTGELPFNYQFVPHILYKGSINISDAEIITL